MSERLIFCGLEAHIFCGALSMQELKNATLHELPETVLLEHGTIRELAAQLTGALPQHRVQQVLASSSTPAHR